MPNPAHQNPAHRKFCPLAPGFAGERARERGIRSANQLYSVLVLLFCLTVVPHEVRAQDAAQPPAQPIAENNAAADPAAADDEREAEKQRKAMAGLMALCGILIVGLLFLIVVMWWGARLRRVARADLPAQKTLQNDLWFLKPPKQPPEQ